VDQVVKMTKTGYIEHRRLAHIPVRHQVEHEFCFFLHDAIAAVSVSTEGAGLGRIQISPLSEDEYSFLEDCEDPIEFLIQTGRTETEKQLMMAHICRALIPDMLHFIHGALIALEKRKFTLAFANFRKPFLEATPILALMCADDKGFFEKFREDPVKFFDNSTLNRPEKRNAIAAAVGKVDTYGSLDADIIFSSVIDLKNPAGLAPLFDKAIHLVTKGSAIRTKPYNLNFIFKNPLDNDIYETSYFMISYVLLFIHSMQIHLLKGLGFQDETYNTIMETRAIGAFEAIYSKGRSQMVKLVNETFAGMMNCPGCKEPIKLRKRAAADFFLNEKLVCPKCGNSHTFPMTWLYSAHFKP